MAHALTRNDFLREPGLLISILAHVLVLLVLGLNLDLMPRQPPQPVRLAIQATVVDAKAMRQKTAEAERAARDAEQRRLDQERERRREDQRRRLEQEQTRQAQDKQQRQALEQQRAEDRKRQAQAEQKRKDEARRKQEDEKARQAKAEQQRKQAEQQERAAAEAKRKDEAQRRQAQREADLARTMAEEEELTAAADSGLLDQYAEVIRQKVERNWMRPASAREGIDCKVQVKQIPGGEVVDVRVTECNGDAAVVRSIEAAVLRSSPLPPPPDPALFDRSLRFDFRPRD